MAWNGSDLKRNAESVSLRGKGKAKPQGSAKVIVAIITTVIVALAGWFFFAKPTKIATVLKQRKPAPIALAEDTSKANKQSRRALAPKTKPTTVSQAFSNLEDVATPTKINPIAKPIDLTKFPKPVYNSGAEQILATIFTAEVGEMPPPVPEMDEDDAKNIVSILISDNPIRDTDNDFVAASKEILRSAKKEMMDFLHKGGDPNEFIRHYCDELQRMCDYRDEALCQAGCLKEEDPALAEEFRKKINESFAKDGIKQISREDLFPEEDTKID